MSVAVYVAGGINRRSERRPKARSSTSCWGPSPRRSCCTASRSSTAPPAPRTCTNRQAASPTTVLGDSPILLDRHRAAAGRLRLQGGGGARSTCGRPTCTTARRRRSPRYMAAAVKAAAFAALLRVWIEALPASVRMSGTAPSGGSRHRHDGRRQRRRAAAAQPQAHARLLEHRARRLHPRRASRREHRRRSTRCCSTCWHTRSRRWARSRSSCALGAADAPRDDDRRLRTASGRCGRGSPSPWRCSCSRCSDSRSSAAMGSSPSGTCCRPRFRRRRRRCALAVLLVPDSVVSAGYYLYVVMVMFMKPRPEDAAPLPALGGIARAVVVASVAILLAFGVVSQPGRALDRAAPHAEP